MAEILHQLIGKLSHYLQGFIHPRWLFGISAINSMFFGQMVLIKDEEIRIDVLIKLDYERRCAI